MPIIANREPPIAVLCTLRQAMLWMMREELPRDLPPRPVPQTILNLDEYRREFAALFEALRDGRIPLYGKPGLGAPRNHHGPSGDFRGFDFAEYGEYVQIPPDDIASISAKDLDIERHMILMKTRDTLTPLTSYALQGNVEAAWSFGGVAIATADLLREFPSSDGQAIDVPDPGERPPLMEWQDEEAEESSPEPAGPTAADTATMVGMTAASNSTGRLPVKAQKSLVKKWGAEWLAIEKAAGRPLTEAKFIAAAQEKGIGRGAARAWWQTTDAVRRPGQRAVDDSPKSPARKGR